MYRGEPDNNKEWKPRYFFVEAPHPTDMGLTQEQEAAEVRAATRRRLEALRDRAEKASSKGKRPLTEGVLPLTTIHIDDHERMPPCPKSGRSQQSARVEPSSKEQTSPDGFSLAKVLVHVFLGFSEGAYINDIPSAAYAIVRGSTLPADAALIDDLPIESAFITEMSTGVQSLQYQASLYTKLKKAQENAEYSTDKLLGTIQENENLKARLIQAEKAEVEGQAASENFESLQAEVLRLGGRGGMVARKGKWPGEEEAEEEERLAKMLAGVEASKEDGSEDEGTADEEVEAVQPDLGDQ
ncbi:hypothetical protein O6P43_020349 [Quillaja saponaria]|uniref:Uncharacterized protein n=1 Tax=Quillaja saponaria TaxID=32244 RepID=A0AAD7LM28_QUISA|nr:hypothetical protein O6P43_020349 [Quillaja saponaria]